MAQSVQDLRPESRPDAIPVPFPWLGRSLVLLFTIVPFAALRGRRSSSSGSAGISWTDVCIILVYYFLTGIGITIGFHRHFTHQSFQASASGCASRSRSPDRWPSRARSSPGSPTTAVTTRSPTRKATRIRRISRRSEGVRGVVKGLWHAHIGWLFDAEQTSADARYAPDLLAGPGDGQDPQAVPLSRRRRRSSSRRCIGFARHAGRSAGRSPRSCGAGSSASSCSTT